MGWKEEGGIADKKVTLGMVVYRCQDYSLLNVLISGGQESKALCKASLLQLATHMIIFLLSYSTSILLSSTSCRDCWIISDLWTSNFFQGQGFCHHKICTTLGTNDKHNAPEELFTEVK